MLRPTIYIPSRLTKLLAPRNWVPAEVSDRQEPVTVVAHGATSGWLSSPSLQTCGC
jgi:hypothetical protein